MEELDVNYSFDEAEDLFDDYFDNVNLNKELEKFYELILDDELNDNFIKESNLSNTRNDNYKRYYEIDLSKIENLSEDFDNIVNEIKKIYSFISPKRLLDSDIEDTYETKKILDALYKHLGELTRLVTNELSIIEKQNNERQEKIKNLKYKNIDRRTLEKILNKYNYIVIYNANLENNVFDNYKKQLKRKAYINEIYKIINLETDYETNTLSELDKLNIQIKKEIARLYEKIKYIEDLIFDKSKYIEEFDVFKKYITNLIAYDDANYSDAYRVYTSLKDIKIESTLNYFEDSIVAEIENIKQEEKFVYERQGIRNIRISLDYISANYLDELSKEEKDVINHLYEEITNPEHDVHEMYNSLNSLVTRIWENSITKVEKYNENEDFNFICTNNEFLDERHSSILITRKMLDRVMDYSNYKIGFICDYSSNVLYITENDDIMSVDYEDMSNLKTPKQIEQEFLNFKICNRIALNGYITRFKAVYVIDDGSEKNKIKAQELSVQYKLPLIVLKKDKN